MPNKRAQPHVWHVGGEDVHLRIPLLQELQKRGFRVGAAGTYEGDLFTQNKIPFYSYSLKRGLSPFKDLLAIKQLRKLFRNNGVQIVHAFDTKPGYLVPMAASEVNGTKIVRTVTGMGYLFSAETPLTKMLRPVYRHLQKKASRLANRTIFQNSDDADFFLKERIVSHEKQGIIMGSGVDASQFDRSQIASDKLNRLREELQLKEGPVVALIARLVRPKGIAEYLEAARLVCAQFPETQFLLVGPHDSEAKETVPLELIQKYQDVVRYIGPCREIPTLLALTDVMTLPSYYREGVPRILLEAGLMGIPLVTTDMPGCREVVDDGQNGYLIPPRDSKALAEALIKLLASPSDRKEMGQRSSEKVRETFELSVVADAYSRIYEAVLDA